jgi:tetratricopeptide (TPR) repeat protein
MRRINLLLLTLISTSFSFLGGAVMAQEPTVCIINGTSYPYHSCHCQGGCGGDVYTSPSPGPSSEEIAKQQRIADAHRLNDEGNEAYHRADYAAAIDLYRLALDKTPDDATIRENLANARAAKKKRDDEEAFRARAAAASARLKGVTPDDIELKGSGESSLDLKGPAGSDAPLAIKSHNSGAAGSSVAGADVAAVVLIRQTDIASLQDEIKRTQEGLKQLEKSSTLDQDERREWEREAEESMGDARLLGLNLTLDFLGAHVGHQLESANGELNSNLQALASGVGSGDGEASRRAGLHTAFAVLKNRRDELARIQGEVKLAQNLEEIREQLNTIDGKGSESTPELIYGVLDKFDAADKVGPAKDLIDSAYTIYREAESFSLLATFNDNADKYLEASRKLSQRMTTLVNAQKALTAHSE